MVEYAESLVRKAAFVPLCVRVELVKLQVIFSVSALNTQFVVVTVKKTSEA